MSSRPMLKPFLVVTSGDMSGNITSLPTNIEQISCLSYDIAWTGTPTGTFAVQVSNTYVPSAAPGNLRQNAGNWTTIPAANFQGTYPTPAGSADNGALDLDVTAFSWVRLVYTRSSGTGTLNVMVAGKVT